MSNAIDRLEYLGEALRTLMQETHAGDATGHWDGVECDGLCLSEDFDGAIEDAKAELNTALKQIYLLHTELSAHQSVLYQLGRAGEVTPAYGEDGRKVLDAVPKEFLEQGRELVYPPKQPQEGEL